jgi:hypothetical protein
LSWTAVGFEVLGEVTVKVVVFRAVIPSRYPQGRRAELVDGFYDLFFNLRTRRYNPEGWKFSWITAVGFPA